MTVHEQFAEDLALYALDALDADQRAMIEAHLRECAGCTAELERLRGDAALLAFSVSGPRPPARSRQRLLSAISREPKLIPARRSRWITWWRGLEWACAMAAVVVLVLVVRENSQLKRQVARLGSDSVQQQEQLLQAKQLLSTLTSTEAERYTLVASKTPPQPQGRAIYVASNGTLVFLANNMPELPPEKIYELWLIPTSGSPIPAGLFRPNAQGSASVVRPPLPAGIEAKTFAITVEPKPGSAAPTSQPIMVGTRG